MEKDKEQDNELIERIFNKSFEKFYDDNFDKLYDEVYQEYKRIRDKNQYQKFKEENGYNDLLLRGRDKIKNNVYGKIKTSIMGYLKNGTLLIKIENKKNINPKQTVVNPKINEKINQAVIFEIKQMIEDDKKKRLSDNNSQNDCELTKIGIDDKLINNNNESNYLDNAQIKNETQNNNESFDKYLNDNNKNNIAINYNNEKQENNPKSFYDKKEKRNLIIGNKTQKKKFKSNSITN